VCLLHHSCWQAVPTQLLLQHQTKLYLIDLTDTTRDLFYHLALHRWEAHGQLELDPPLPVADLLLAALGEEAAAGRWQVGSAANGQGVCVVGGWGRGEAGGLAPLERQAAGRQPGSRQL
jgi:hypothetical protein